MSFKLFLNKMKTQFGAFRNDASDHYFMLLRRRDERKRMKWDKIDLQIQRSKKKSNEAKVKKTLKIYSIIQSRFTNLRHLKTNCENPSRNSQI